MRLEVNREKNIFEAPLYNLMNGEKSLGANILNKGVK